MSIVAEPVKRHDLSRRIGDAGLPDLDRDFLVRLRADAPNLHCGLLAYRDGRVKTTQEISALLLACAPMLEKYIAALFGIERELQAHQDSTRSHDPVFAFKNLFVEKHARKRTVKDDFPDTFQELDQWLEATLVHWKLESQDKERAVALLAERLLADERANAPEIERLARWCLRVQSTPEGCAMVRDWVSFRRPQIRGRLSPVQVRPIQDDASGRLEGGSDVRRRRDGFTLTDPRMSAREVQGEIDYCVYCHDHDGDFCSKGFPKKKGDPAQGLKVDPLGVTLTGCPLDEKISEMHTLKREGLAIAALAMVMVDNPMCPATGHRICNDCMKSCIYQKQDPVNIPQIETRCLTDVLALPWGVEIYDLLTRWNPLRPRQWLAKPYNGLKVLVCGMGPAGFTLSHHLLMEGFAVVGIDGLKIEPLPRELIDKPIRDYAALAESLDDRIVLGFGGVAEYGITVRWDKNFLKLIYLTLARRPHFQVFGGVRFGGTITVEEAWQLGFDHVAIAVGAGLPQALPIPGSLAPGMRQATDFLMTLQLSGASRPSSLSSLQVRLPAIVIGGGLTAIDTATEVQAYYIVQVERTLDRYETLLSHYGVEQVREVFDEKGRKILDEFLSHGRSVRAERERAAKVGEAPNFIPLIRQWGGVTVVYRRRMADSPACSRNHEEVNAALAEGVCYADGLEPLEAILDRFGHLEAMVFTRHHADATDTANGMNATLTFPAHSVLVATGARPNVAYEFEHKGHFQKSGTYYQGYRRVNGHHEPADIPAHCKADGFGPFTSYTQGHRRVSFLGDAHPAFSGSVVKAIASARRTYPQIVEELSPQMKRSGNLEQYRAFRRRLHGLFDAQIVQVVHHNPQVTELRVRAPQAVKQFRPGQFFRLQNYETLSRLSDGTRLQIEPLALTGALSDGESGCVSLFVYKKGASSQFCETLCAGDPVSLMGPAGTPTKIPSGETVMIVTRDVGVPHVLSVGAAMRAQGNRVLHVAMYENARDVYRRDVVEDAADVTIWCTAHGEPIKAGRRSDYAATGDIVDIVQRYARGEYHDGSPPIPLRDVDRLLLIGESGMVRRMRDARDCELREFFKRKPETIGSVGTPMHCMLKGVCAQCLQWQVDPTTGRRTKAVFACSWQDQPLDIVDLDNLDERQSQNAVLERLTALWYEYRKSAPDSRRRRIMPNASA